MKMTTLQSPSQLSLPAKQKVNYTSNYEIIKLKVSTLKSQKEDFFLEPLLNSKLACTPPLWFFLEAEMLASR